MFSNCSSYMKLIQAALLKTSQTNTSTWITRRIKTDSTVLIAQKLSSPATSTSGNLDSMVKLQDVMPFSTQLESWAQVKLIQQLGSLKGGHLLWRWWVLSKMHSESCCHARRRRRGREGEVGVWVLKFGS